MIIDQLKEQRNDRLIEELRTIREERDILLQIGYRNPHESTGNYIEPKLETEVEKENSELKRKIGRIYLQQNSQHDSLRRVGLYSH